MRGRLPNTWEGLPNPRGVCIRGVRPTQEVCIQGALPNPGGGGICIQRGLPNPPGLPTVGGWDSKHHVTAKSKQNVTWQSCVKSLPGQQREPNTRRVHSIAFSGEGEGGTGERKGAHGEEGKGTGEEGGGLQYHSKLFIQLPRVRIQSRTLISSGSRSTK